MPGSPYDRVTGCSACGADPAGVPPVLWHEAGCPVELADLTQRINAALAAYQAAYGAWLLTGTGDGAGAIATTGRELSGVLCSFTAWSERLAARLAETRRGSDGRKPPAYGTEAGAADLAQPSQSGNGDGHGQS